MSMVLTCTKCKLEKDESEFRVAPRYTLRNNRYCWCRDCEKAYRESNKDKTNKYNSEYYANNSDKSKSNAKEYVKNNPEKVAVRAKKYYEENKEKISAYKR